MSRAIVYSAVILIGTAWLAVVPAATAQSTCQGPGNDCFFNFIELASPASVSSSNVGYTTEAGEPATCGSMTRTAWYAFTAVSAGQATVHTLGSSFDTVLAVHTGTSLWDLSGVACNDDSHETLQSYVSFACVPDMRYWIQVGGYNGEQGTFSLNVDGCTLVPPAPQSVSAKSPSFALRVDLTWTPVMSQPPAMGYHIYRGLSPQETAFYRALSDPQLGSFRDTNVSPSTTYWYRISAFNSWGQGPLSAPVSATTLCWSANNDCFANATSLGQERAITFTAIAAGAGREAGEPLTCGTSAPTLWFIFTAATDGQARIERVGGSAEGALAAYEGWSLSSLDERACGSLGGGPLTFACVAGGSYRLQVAVEEGGETDLRLDGCGPSKRSIQTTGRPSIDVHESTSGTACGQVALCARNVVGEVTLRADVDPSLSLLGKERIGGAETRAYAATPFSSNGMGARALLVAPPPPPGVGPGGVPDPERFPLWVADVRDWAASSIPQAG